MPRPDGRVRPGEPIGSAISARAYNRALDAADWVFTNKNGKLGKGSTGWSPPYTRVAARPSIAVEKFGVVRVTGIVTDPTIPEDYQPTTGFEVMPCLEVAAPASSSDQIAIALGPVEANAVGWFAVAGAVQVKLNIVSEVDTAAVPVVGNVQQLKTGGSGYPLLWKEPGVGVGKWGLVLLAKGGGGNPVRLGKFEGAWPVGETKLVTFVHGGEDEVTARNLFCAVGEACGSQRWCAVFEENGEWYLLAAECGAHM